MYHSNSSLPQQNAIQIKRNRSFQTQNAAKYNNIPQTSQWQRRYFILQSPVKIWSPDVRPDLLFPRESLWKDRTCCQGKVTERDVYFAVSFPLEMGCSVFPTEFDSFYGCSWQGRGELRALSAWKEAVPHYLEQPWTACSPWLTAVPTSSADVDSWTMFSVFSKVWFWVNGWINILFQCITVWRRNKITLQHWNIHNVQTRMHKPYGHLKVPQRRVQEKMFKTSWLGC